MIRSLAWLAFAVCILAIGLPPVRGAELPPLEVGAGWGVNIHFTDAKPGELKMIRDAGFRFVRMDFTWGATEKKAGEYDFAAYDRLMTALDEHGLRALFILDYANKLYDDGLAPHTDVGREAFAKWAKAAVERFKGRGIVWEMWNEPNIAQFWKPKPNVGDYIKLATAVGKAVRAAGPEELYVGPATSTIDLPFLEACFKGGLLQHWSAVTVHPYRQTRPETAIEEYRALRLLIERYAPEEKEIPILSGEWGYSTAWNGFDAERQAKYLVRQYMVNLYQEVPVSIWYDWRDDGRDPKEAEHNFGTVQHEYRKDNDPVYEPKPAYKAASQLGKELTGYTFSKRLVCGDSATDFALLFSKGKDVKVVAWTTSKDPRELNIPASDGPFKVADLYGGSRPDVTAEGKHLKFMASQSPIYLTPAAPNDVLRVAAAWERAKPETSVRTGDGASWINLDFRNPLDSTVRAVGGLEDVLEARPVTLDGGASGVIPTRFGVLRNPQPTALRLALFVEGVGKMVQETHVVVSNPLIVTPLAVVGDTLAVRVENPAGDEFNGRLIVSQADSALGVRLPFDAGQKETTVRVPIAAKGRTPYRFEVRVHDYDRNLVANVPTRTYQSIDDFAPAGDKGATERWKAVTEGKDDVASEQSVAAAAPAGGAPAKDLPVLALKYKLDPGEKFIKLQPASDELRTIAGEPGEVVMWIHGDGSGNHARIRYTDANGETFQSGTRLTWTGWQRVTIPLHAPDAGHWGGDNDGVVQYPIRLDTLLLIDNANRAQKTEGTVYVAAPVTVGK